MAVRIAGVDHDIRIGDVYQDLRIGGVHYTTTGDAPARVFRLAGVSVSGGDINLMVRLRIGRSARTNGNAAQIHLWNVTGGDGFEPVVGEILEGSMDITYNSVTTADALRRIFIQEDLGGRFGFNRATGVSAPDLSMMFPEGNSQSDTPADIDQKFSIIKKVATSDGYVLETNDGLDDADTTNRSASVNATFARWDRSQQRIGGVARHYLTEDINSLIQGLEAGDEIIFVIHTGTISFELTDDTPAPAPFGVDSFVPRPGATTTGNIGHYTGGSEDQGWYNTVVYTPSIGAANTAWLINSTTIDLLGFRVTDDGIAWIRIRWDNANADIDGETNANTRIYIQAPADSGVETVVLRMSGTQLNRRSNNEIRFRHTGDNNIVPESGDLPAMVSHISGGGEFLIAFQQGG